ncbi:MAG: hypothetical protein L0241_06135 [Planctomycetia bacterium]|nr:hypothetical protein [Planctomycetia bacterium]
MTNAKEILSVLNCGRMARAQRGSRVKKSVRAVVGTLATRPSASVAELANATGHSWATVRDTLEQLKADGFVQNGRMVSIPDWAATYKKGVEDRIQYITIPALIENGEPISLTANRLLWLIVSFSRSGECYLSVKGFADMLGVSRQTIQDCLFDLVNSDFIFDNVGLWKPNLEAILGHLNKWQSGIEGMTASELLRWQRWLRDLFIYAGFLKATSNFLNAVVKRWPCRRAWHSEEEWAEQVGRVILAVASKASKEGNMPYRAVLRRLGKIKKIDYSVGTKVFPTNVTPIDVLETLTPKFLAEREAESVAAEAKHIAQHEADKRSSAPRPMREEYRDNLPLEEERRANHTASLRTVYEPTFRECFANADKRGAIDTKNDSPVWILCHRHIRDDWDRNECAALHQLFHKGRVITGDDIAAAQNPDVWAIWDELDGQRKK